MSEIPRNDATVTSDAALPRALVRLMRPQQWIKNLLLFAALVFAEKLFVPESLLLAVLGFASFCLASSSVYVVNDLLDAERDRLHPEKRRRPIASGAVPPPAAVFLALALTVAALSLAAWIRPAFAWSVLIYMGLTHFYSLAGKNVVILDVMLIAAGFVVRAIAGALAIQVPISDWFIVCTAFLALFVALSKRKAEMLALDEDASQARPVLARYTTPSLNAFTATSMAAALISYALYVLDSHQQTLAEFPLLWLTVPCVLFALFRYHLLVESGRQGEKPEEVVLTDRPIQFSVLGFAIAAVGALYLGG
jgi:4-hydroxybenzoate polyprenyltransferase